MTKFGTISIIGRPNAGKSTLLNKALGASLAIVTPKAQTTRYQTRGILSDPAKGQIVFVDTPGVHSAKAGGINEAMMSETRGALESPDLIWYLVDPNSAMFHEAAVIELIRGIKSPVIVLENKSDLRPFPRAFDAEIQKGLEDAGISLVAVMSISAHQGDGLERLLEVSWDRMPLGEPAYPLEDDALSDRPLRFFVAELIREQLLLQLEEEVPYGCAVEIERFQESVRPVRIEAVIHVDRESQKGIVIGRGGAMLKAIGSQARKKIEELIGQKVFLGLKVKVYKDWTKNAHALRKLGFHQ